MTQSLSGVVKKDRVRDAGPCRISAGGAAAGGAAGRGGGRATVRVVQQAEDRAVLEVRCRCGQVTYLECRWPAPAAAPNVQ